MGTFLETKSVGDINTLEDRMKLLEATLAKAQEHEQMLQRAIAIANLGIWRYDILGDQVEWSEEVYEIYGMDPATDVPTIDKVFDYANPAEKETIEGIINEAISTGKEYNVDCRIRTKQGQAKYVNAIGKPFYNTKGEITHLFGTVMDITNRRNHEWRLRFSDYTIESISEGVYWINEQAEFVRANEGAARMLGYSQEELIGLSGKDINPSFTKEMSQEYWQKTREKGVFVFETEHERKDGQLIPVEITNNVFHFEGQEFRVSIVRDITERKERERQILKAMAEVEKLKNQLQEENVYLREEIKLDLNVSNIITSNRRFKALLDEARQVSETDATVLITGESGTGKELLALAIHNLSSRKSRPMIKVNCASLPATLIESELFGHEKGAYTGAMQRKTGRFELAMEGTIFLDEIGELPLELQAKLLRVIQEKEFERLGGTETIRSDVRIIAATNRDLEKEVAAGNFREDLYYRINVFPLETIPLRERKEDIPPLVKFFIEKYALKSAKDIKNISKKALEALQSYSWPGNVRELENLIERAVILTKGHVVEAGPWLPKAKALTGKKVLTLEEVEKQHIREVLTMTDGKISGPEGAAELLGLNQNTLYSRLRKFDLIPKKRF